MLARIARRTRTSGWFGPIARTEFVDLQHDQSRHDDAAGRLLDDYATGTTQPRAAFVDPSDRGRLLADIALIRRPDIASLRISGAG